MMKRVFQFVATALLLATFFACDSKDKDVVASKDFGAVKSFINSGCKGHYQGFRAISNEPEVIVWEALKGGVLKLSHNDIVAGCGLDKAYSISTKREGDKLYVVEHIDEQSEIATNCICQYDLTTELKGFEIGKSYTLVYKKNDWVLGTINFTYTSLLKGKSVIKRG